MRYKHIFFDLDHTLWDFEANSNATLQELFYEHNLAGKGISSYADFFVVYSEINDKLWDRFRKGFINRNELRIKRFTQTFLAFKLCDDKLCQTLSERFLEILPTKTALFPDTVEVLDYLRDKQYPLHLITNGFEETQKLKLQHSGIGHYFTHIVTSESAGSLKPHREIFDYAMKLSNTTAADSIMIGDTLEVDILGAQQAGMDQVYFAPNLVQQGVSPTYTIKNLSELKNIL
ncbi:YjjG family noncanonical pyrimidine nucleotidase [Chitinophaga sp. NPDC101104]|uniref:YjjG family noncanonical pyrimidine nucleotidase n=1 Tax=Chitinophaga sp. NPDC101104 TaxID=3390561 RepID=UPI003D085DCB